MRISDWSSDVCSSDLISLSFSPYARDIEAQVASARRAGHEVLIDLPIEPLGFPRDDPGPSTLLTSLSLLDNLNRLAWVLGQAAGYVGVTTWQGSQFTPVEAALIARKSPRLNSS